MAPGYRTDVHSISLPLTVLCWREAHARLCLSAFPTVGGLNSTKWETAPSLSPGKPMLLPDGSSFLPLPFLFSPPFLPSIALHVGHAG